MIKKSELTSTVDPSPRDILDALMIVREKQDKKWGGPEHDDGHRRMEWVRMIIQEADKFSLNQAEFVETMLEVAALAFAAIQSDARIAAKYFVKIKVGIEEGDICNREGCLGTMEWTKDGECTCHINPPCSACTDGRLTCTKCGAQPDPERESPHEWLDEQKSHSGPC
jgi:hypothetical protein